MTPHGKAASEICAKHPNTASMTLARMLFKQEPLLFKNAEHARDLVRYYRGRMGKENKARVSRAGSIVQSAKAKLCPFENLPEGITHFSERTPLKITGKATVLVLSDIHAPYHDKQALSLAMKMGKKRKATHVILNGDIADFFSISFWEKDPRKRDLAAEIKVIKKVLASIRRVFPRARIIYKLGNHEERWERYLSVKAPELLGVEDFEIDKVLGLKSLGMEIVRDCRPIRLGKLNIIHGHEFRWGITSPVNPARGFYQRGKEHALGGHLHQTSSHSEKSMNDVVISCWSTGCLCDLKPDYARFNKWNHGFAIVEAQKNGRFMVNNYKIMDGTLFDD